MKEKPIKYGCACDNILIKVYSIEVHAYACETASYYRNKILKCIYYTELVEYKTINQSFY